MEGRVISRGVSTFGSFGRSSPPFRGSLLGFTGWNWVVLAAGMQVCAEPAVHIHGRRTTPNKMEVLMGISGRRLEGVGYSHNFVPPYVNYVPPAPESDVSRTLNFDLRVGGGTLPDTSRLGTCARLIAADLVESGINPVDNGTMRTRAGLNST